jgi:hypothetical protein
MAIEPTIKIPSDSSARITAASLLGGNYLELMPGAATDTLGAGAVIYDTRDPISLSDLLGKAVFSSNNRRINMPQLMRQPAIIWSAIHAKVRAYRRVAAACYVGGDCLPLAILGWLFLGRSAGATTWIDGNKARLQALDKITARISTVEAPVGAARFYGTLEITINRCAFHPPENRRKMLLLSRFATAAMMGLPQSRFSQAGFFPPAQRYRRLNIRFMI